MNTLITKLSMNTILIIVALIIIDVLISVLLFKLLFKNKRKLKKDVGYAITPDIVSLFKGRYFKDQISEFKIGLYTFSIIGILAVNVYLITQLL